jgi:hypothetical protein
MPGRGQKGILKPDKPEICTRCKQMPVGASGVRGVCSTCLLYEKVKLPSAPEVKK